MRVFFANFCEGLPADAQAHASVALRDSLERDMELACDEDLLAQVDAERVDAAHQAPFDEARYLALHGDVAAAVKAGLFESGLQHYQQYGRHEGRQRR
jgi:hypothetical protein